MTLIKSSNISCMFMIPDKCYRYGKVINNLEETVPAAWGFVNFITLMISVRKTFGFLVFSEGISSEHWQKYVCVSEGK